jgi:transcriptional activator SPT7
MKENDRQGCFLSPVTDDIATGYSKVITKPICLSEIEKKAIDLEYTSLNRFESDVQLMFDNCIKYNIGSSGQWFRGEARRQQKKWKDTILKSSKEMHNPEMSKRIGKNKVVPSEPSQKKSK